MNRIVRIYWPELNFVGPGAIQNISTEITKRGWKKILLVTDAPLVQFGVAAKIEAVLKSADIPYVIYDGAVPNPTMKNVEGGLAVFQSEGCDAIVSLGGGSPQDCAKAIAILATNGGSISDYEGIEKSTKRGTPIIAVNTTAGTASEVTINYVITDEIRKIKMVMVDPNSLPLVAINDPELMLSVPKGTTAATGLDALCHAVESYVTAGAFGLSDVLSYESIRLIGESLEQAVADGSNLEARTKMAWASYIAGLSFSNAGLGIVHSMAHQLGSEYDIAHGVANAILMPYVEAFNAEKCPAKFAKVAEALGKDITGLNEQEAAQCAVNAIMELCRKLDIPALKDTAFQVADIPKLAQQALADACTGGNPRSVTVEDLEALYLKCYNEEI